MSNLYLLLLVALKLSAESFNPQWQVELYTFFDQEPGLAVLYNDSLYFTEWRARNDCPGINLYQVSLLRNNKPERIQNFNCIFKMWTTSEGLLVAYKNDQTEKELLFKRLKNDQWQETEEKEIKAYLKLKTKREYIDSISLCERKAFSLEKKKQTYLLKSIADNTVLNTFEINNRNFYPLGPLRFITCIKDTFLWLEPKEDEEESTSTFWSHKKNGRPISIGLNSLDSISGISTYQDGIVVSYSSSKKVFWFGNNLEHFKKQFHTSWTHIRYNPSAIYRKGDIK